MMPETNHNQVVLEVCIASVEDALAAVAGGADRLELNVGLEVGGLTPSWGLLTEVKQATPVPVIAMIRPRGAGFVYSTAERRVMVRDAGRLLESGADGLAFGVLTTERQIDVGGCRAFVELAGARDTVFHRAFDVVADSRLAAEILVDLGVTRVMTSGQADSAIHGAHTIADIRQRVAGRLEVLPAGGVRPENVRELLRLTACRQVHGSFRQYRHDAAGVVADSQVGFTDRALVAAVRQAIDA